MECGDNQFAFSLGWDLHPFGVFNADMSFVLQNPPLLDSDSTSGYLQDAVTEWSSPCKRRRVQLFQDDQTVDDPDEFLQSCWNLNYTEDALANYSILSRNFEDDSPNSSFSSIIDVVKTPVTAATPKIEEEENISCLSSSKKSSLTGDKDEKAPSTDSADPPLSSENPDRRRKKIVYPFAWVKPGGVEGDVTLNEINARILRRPNRPVRHPIGEFACLPFCSPDGPGLSGKSVVALTRVHTHGNGTITIIRTRG
ncbi:protein XRI1-like [Aristolochia californica]|uniref:protein XRI1-like n=1 Tax=Aristolochia californica TaxID=171875 RepID=UPI0035E0AAA6